MVHSGQEADVSLLQRESRPETSLPEPVILFLLFFNFFKKTLFKSWEKPHILYGNFLDWIRYLVAWQPIIVIGVQSINWVFGLE